jgi:hypothetical protein
MGACRYRGSVMTTLQEIVGLLKNAGAYNRNDQVGPAVILWSDKERQWEHLLPLLRPTLPEVLTLSDAYDQGTKSGPAIWIRCMIARKLPEVTWAEKTVPIIYMPGVSRQDFRAPEDCPDYILPLVETQFRSVFWTQVNGKDWTILAFLQSEEGGLGLDVARDAATLEAIRLALPKLAEVEVAELRGKKLEASDFHHLLSPDPVRQLLDWINDPSTVQGKMSDSEWKAFAKRCTDEFTFNPAKQPPIKAAELLGKREGNWQHVWNRFREAPSALS